MALVHIDGPQLDAMIAGVPDDLRRGIKAQRLAVQKGAGESSRIVAFDPGRYIDQKREAGGVGFGKAIIGEAFDLLEAALGEIAFVAIGLHAGDELLPEAVDFAVMTEGGHGPAQAIGLGRAETGADDGDLHGLFLEQGYAQGLAQHLLQFGGRKIHFFLAPAAAQVGMHHVALDGAGTDDGHLDHQVVEIARLESGQHAHLGAAFDLEDADGIAPAQHIVYRRVFGRQGGQGQRPAVVASDQLKGLADAGQHAQAQYVHLEDAERIQVILVPFDNRALGHGGVADGHHFAQRAPGDHHAAGMLGQMAGKAGHFPGQGDGLGDGTVARVQPGFADVAGGHAVPPPPPGGALQGDNDVAGQAQGLAHFADGAFGTVGGDRGGHAGPFAAVLFINVLDDLFPALVFKVHVDIGGLVPFGADEALEQKVDAVRVHRRYPQAIADRRICRRAPALAKDAALPGEADDVVDGEEVRGEVQPGDQVQFMFQLAAHLFGHAIGILMRGIMFSGAHPGQAGQFILRRAATRGVIGGCPPGL